MNTIRFVILALLVTSPLFASPYAPTGLEGELYDQAVQAGREGRTSDMVAALDKLIATFPKSKGVAEVSWIAAKSLEDLGKLSEAAPYYARFAKLEASDPRGPTALKLSALGFHHGSRPREAIAAYRQYLLTTDDRQTEQLFFDFCEHSQQARAAVSYYESQSARLAARPVALAAFLLRVAQRDGLFPAKVRAAAKAKALALAETFSARFQAEEAGRDVLAFKQLEVMRSHRPHFSPPDAKTIRAMSEIGSQWPLSLKRFEDDATTLSRYNSPRQAIAGWNLLARAYQSAMVALSALTPDPSLTAPEVEYFQRTVAALGAIQFRDKAITTALRCTDYAEEFHLFTSEGRDCRLLLSELDPDRYPAVRSRYLPSVQANALSGAGFDARVTALLRDRSFLLSTGLYKDWGLMTGASQPSPASEIEDVTEPMKALPRPAHYGTLESDRFERLTKWLSDEKSRSPNTALLEAEIQRTLDPEKALAIALKQLEINPGEAAWLHVVALCELEMGKTDAALTRLLARAERKEITAGQWNTLGVIAVVRGDEELAARFFYAPLDADRTLEAHENLGFLALKYSNAREALTHFRSAESSGLVSPTLAMGAWAAEAQSGVMTGESNRLEEYSKSFGKDPYFVLSVGYWLLDHERDLSSFPRVIASLLDERGPKGHELAVLRSALRQAVADQASSSRQ